MYYKSGNLVQSGATTYIYAVVRERMSIDKQRKIKYNLFIQCSCVMGMKGFQ